MQIIVTFFMMVVLNWGLKFAVGGFMYWVATSLGLPDWMMICMVAVGAAETKITVNN